MDDINTTVALMQKDIEIVKKAIERVEAKVVGNGVPGLVQDISSIKMQIGFNQPKNVREEIMDLKTELHELSKAFAQLVGLLRWGGVVVGGWTVIQLLQFGRDLLLHAQTINTP